MAHQRRAPARLSSTNNSAQSSRAHSLIRPAKGPVTRSTPSRATMPSRPHASTGAGERASLPLSRRSAAPATGRVAHRFTTATSVASGDPAVRTAVNSRYNASRNCRACVNRTALIATASSVRPASLNQRARSAGCRNRSKQPRQRSPTVAVKLTDKRPPRHRNASSSAGRPTPVSSLTTRRPYRGYLLNR